MFSFSGSHDVMLITSNLFCFHAAQGIQPADGTEPLDELHDSIYNQSSTKFDIESSSLSSDSSVSVVTDNGKKVNKFYLWYSAPLAEQRPC